MDTEDILFRQQLRERLGELEYLVCGSYWELFPGSSKVGMLMDHMDDPRRARITGHIQNNRISVELEQDITDACAALGRCIVRAVIYATAPGAALTEHEVLNKLHGTDEEANAGRKPPCAT